MFSHYIKSSTVIFIKLLFGRAPFGSPSTSALVAHQNLGGYPPSLRHRVTNFIYQRPFPASHPSLYPLQGFRCRSENLFQDVIRRVTAESHVEHEIAAPIPSSSARTAALTLYINRAPRTRSYCTTVLKHWISPHDRIVDTSKWGQSSRCMLCRNVFSGVGNYGIAWCSCPDALCIRYASAVVLHEQNGAV